MKKSELTKVEYKLAILMRSNFGHLIDSEDSTYREQASKRSKLWYSNNTKRSLEANKKWKFKNKDKTLASTKKYYQKNKDKMNKKSREAWHKAEKKLSPYQKEKKAFVYSMYGQIKRLAFPEEFRTTPEMREKQKQKYKDNKEAYSIRSKEYRERNKEKLKIHYKNYRAQNKDSIEARAFLYRNNPEKSKSLKTR